MQGTISVEGAASERHASCWSAAAMRIRFDRGTLVLEAELEGERPELIADAAWDPELRAWRVPADRHASLIAQLVADGVRISDELRVQVTSMAWNLPVL